MRVTRYALSSILSVGLVALGRRECHALSRQVAGGRNFLSSRYSFSSSALKASTEQSVCSVPDVDVDDVSLKVSALKEAILTDHKGDAIRLGDKMGDKSIVVFLRHLG